VDHFVTDDAAIHILVHVCEQMWTLKQYYDSINILFRGGSRNLGNGGGAVKGQSPEPSAEGASAGGGPPQKNFEKLDAISWHIFLGSEWPRISFKMGPLQNKKQ